MEWFPKLLLKRRISSKVQLSALRDTDWTSVHAVLFFTRPTFLGGFFFFCSRNHVKLFLKQWLHGFLQARQKRTWLYGLTVGRIFSFWSWWTRLNSLDHELFTSLWSSKSLFDPAVPRLSLNYIVMQTVLNHPKMTD